MLKTILGILRNKAELMESAELLFENAKNDDIDDLIILGEATDVPKEDDTIELNEDGSDDSKEREDKEDIPEKIDDQEDDTIEEGPSMTEEPPAGLDNPDPMASVNDIPMSKEDELDSIMHVTIDLSTNNMADVVPVTPPAASDAIVSDTLSTNTNPEGNDMDVDKDNILDTPLDSDIGEPPSDGPEDNPDSEDIMNTSLNDTELELPEDDSKKDTEDTSKEEDKPEEDSKEEDDILESVSFSMDDEPEAAADDTATGEDSETPPDKKPNEVTSAVLDKVAEADTTSENDDTSMSDNPDTGSGDMSGNKSADLLKKLGDITNSIENTKKMIIDGLKK